LTFFPDGHEYAWHYWEMETHMELISIAEVFTHLMRHLTRLGKNNGIGKFHIQHVSLSLYLFDRQSCQIRMRYFKRKPHIFDEDMRSGQVLAVSSFFFVYEQNQFTKLTSLFR